MAAQSRLFYIDNIRWMIIVFVVMVHAAVTYSSLGRWYYTEPAEIGIVSMFIFGVFQSFTQGYSMGILFLIAGYFVVSSSTRKSTGKFIYDRFIRLVIPTLVYIFLINTTINYYILSYKWIQPQPSPFEALGWYIKSLDFIGGTGPMWFALALFYFTIIFLLVRPVMRKIRIPMIEKLQPDNKTLLFLALLISLCAFLIRIIQPIGTSQFNMQLSFFSQYVILFITGIIAYKNNWFDNLSYNLGIRWFKIAMIGGTMFWAIIQIAGGGTTEGFEKFAGGLHWQSAAYALWESFFCIGVSAGLIVIFRSRCNSQGRFAKFMSANAFSVYMFHAPILVVIALLMRSMMMPPLLKCLMAGSFAIVASFLISHLILRRIPLLKKIL
jgi:hypothetical protein